MRLRLASVHGVIAALALTVAAGSLMPAVPAAAQGGRSAAFTPSGALDDVVALSARSAWAVGHTGVCDPKSEIARWNGRTWKLAHLPADARQGWLDGVTATSASDVWAAGFADSPAGAMRSLMLHWNGRAWKRVVTPGAQGGVGLVDVTAITARNVWAVGDSDPGKPVMLHWNGRAWRRVPGPSSLGDAFLFGIAGTSARNVWAVGAGARSALILHWNGIRWRREPVNGFPAGSFLMRVTTVSAGNAWAVGSTAANKALIVHWNGTAWRPVAIPDVAGGLIGVTALSAHDGWAVGATYTAVQVACAGTSARAGVGLPGIVRRLRGLTSSASLPLRPIILHWNGTAWLRVKSPQEPDAILVGVAAPKAGTAIAVGGTHIFKANGKILVLRWNGKFWH
jgi:hypothetical protein